MATDTAAVFERTTAALESRQRVVLVLVAISRITGGALFGTAITVYLGEAASPIILTVSFSLFSLGLLLFAPVWGALADVTGRRQDVLIVTAAGSALALVPLAFTVSVPLQVACRVLYAVFVAGFSSVILTVVSETGGASDRGRSIGFYSSAQAGGDIVGRLLVGYLIGVLAPTGVYGVVVAISVLTTVFVLFVVDPTEVPETAASVREVGVEFRRRLVPNRAHLDVLGERGLGWLYVGLCLRNITQKGMSAVLPVYLVTNVGLSSIVMGVVLAVSPVVRVGSMYALGRFSDRTGRKNLIVAGLTGSGLQCLLFVAALLPATILGRAGVSAAAQVVHALTFSALVVGGVAFIADVAPSSRESELMGLRSTARGVGGVVGPLVVGVIATTTDYPSAFLAVTGISFLAAVLVARNLVESHDDAAREADVPVD